MASLHGAYGGKKTKRRHMPAESEALALIVATAMMWAKLRDSTPDSTHPQFFQVISDEVRRAEGSLQHWSRDELHYIFHEKLLCGIGYSLRGLLGSGDRLGPLGTAWDRSGPLGTAWDPRDRSGSLGIVTDGRVY